MVRRALEWLGGSTLVYGLLAACAGASGTHIGPEPSAGQAAVATGGQGTGGAPATSNGGDSDMPAPASGTGGLLDPVPPAMAAGASSGGSSTGADGVSYTKTDVPCSDTIKVAATQYPAAILTLDSPSILIAARTIVVTKAGDLVDDGAWLVASAGGYVSPDGSKVGTTCANGVESITFYVPSR